MGDPEYYGVTEGLSTTVGALEDYVQSYKCEVDTEYLMEQEEIEWKKKEERLAIAKYRDKMVPKNIVQNKRIRVKRFKQKVR